MQKFENGMKLTPQEIDNLQHAYHLYLDMQSHPSEAAYDVMMELFYLCTTEYAQAHKEDHVFFIQIIREEE